MAACSGPFSLLSGVDLDAVPPTDPIRQLSATDVPETVRPGPISVSLRPRIVVARRDWRVLQSLRHNLQSLRPEWDITGCTHAEGALAVIGDGGVNAVVAEVDLPRLGGLTLLETCQARFPWVARVLCCRNLAIDEERRARRLAVARLVEPTTIGELARTLTRLVDAQPIAPPAVVRDVG